ncbi:DNA-binding LacI/PurR family transcriptional regulator [Diaminobutyricimonas aerilata]|uniref:DNA-binding LacI/PurR family transcriptional regulator n=1 Tax=Diaminobutyricimonas aerilata TaxID=1162967 RepID=A0A2M9CIR2_9MICO|nr:LacI family DNA-binding transcriptional regulator [Diaminobutyricimonas aerilata]PJJ71752.1 DNA-binding LacI/PurR family transcriptional regulator [Diaminobutyricimonas aerilata]
MNSARPRRPTIRDVAEAAGVSRGTVSRVLQGGHWVSPEASRAVNAAIKKTGYRVNPHARSLATKRTNSVGFLLTERLELLFEDPNFAELMGGVARALAEIDVSLVVLMAGTAAEQRRASDYIQQGHVDGVLLVSWHNSGMDLVGQLHTAGVPLISCGVPLGYERKIGWVAADDREGGRIATAHLVALGRRRIATITGPQDTAGARQRLEGYREELGDTVDEALIERGDYSEASGARAMRALLDRAPDLDAVFAANDRMAAGALTELRAAGRRVPEHVAVVGFDDAPVARRTDPELTTLRQPFDRITSEMVRLLMQVIDGAPPATITLPTELVVRGSA